MHLIVHLILHLYKTADLKIIKMEIIRELDISTLEQKSRHPEVFKQFNELHPGQSLMFINTYDPISLFIQFNYAFKGGFFWEYVEDGPKFWKVIISKSQTSNLKSKY